jgi:hypothetical protein
VQVVALFPQYCCSRQRKKVEALFAKLKHQVGLRRLRLRRLKFVREQFFLTSVKIAVVAPMPKASVIKPVAVKLGAFLNCRTASRKSVSIRPSHGVLT